MIPFLTRYRSALMFAGLLMAQPAFAADSFRFLSFSNEDTAELAGKSGDGVVVIDRPSTRFGIPVRLQATGGVVALYPNSPDNMTGKQAAGTLRKKGVIAKDAPPALTFTAQNAPRQLVIVFKQGETRKAWVFADTLKQFPYGSTSVINMTGNKASFTMDSVTQELPPNSTKTFRPDLGDGESETPVSVKDLRKGKEQLVFSTVWISRKDCRNFVFLTTNAAGQTEVRSISDRESTVTAEAPEEKPEKAPKQQ